MKQFLLLLFCISFLILNLEARPKTVKGTVFEDTNNNGLLDKGEKGIPGVAVSNQMQVVQTDGQGRYKLKIDSGTIIFITKPAGYNLPLSENNLPRFYYIHQPEGSPTGLKYPGIAPTGKRPKRINFPLLKGEKKDNFRVIVVGDPQTATAEEVDFYRDHVVNRMLDTSASADFYLALGDIMYDDLSHYGTINRLTAQLGMPVHNVPGNHDMNFRLPDHKHSYDTFNRIHGPDYYSFNHGSVHFVVLSTVRYHGWDKEKNKKGYYTGVIGDRQLVWLRNDLAQVPEDHLVVLTMHIPVTSSLYRKHEGLTNRDALFGVLKNRKNILGLAGHEHFWEYQELHNDPESGWDQQTPFTLITAGAGCGSWWKGPKDAYGIPLGLCTDGMPNGHFTFDFKGTGFSYRFHPASVSRHKGMRINTPRGEVSKEEIVKGTVTLNINVFTGTPRTKVTYILDDGAEAPLERKVMEDPFYAGVLKKNPDAYLDWITPTLSGHIWEAPLPGDLEPGLHRLKVKVTGHFGEVFEALHLFEVTTG